MQDVHKSFDGVSVLNGVDFSVKKGERLCLLGPGGSGKSTILKTILGILTADEGEVRLLGTDMTRSTSDQKQDTLRRVGMAFQQGALFDYMTVAENLEFAMEHMTDLSRPAMQERVDKLLHGVKLPKTKAMLPHELSGGMQRRVGIARALSTDPVLAIFDEPTSGLDPVTSTIILNMINELVPNDAFHTALICTTNVEIGIRFARRIIVVNEGRVAADGEWRSLLLDGPEWVRNFLSVRLIGLDLGYAQELDLPKAFIEAHWS